MATIHPELIRIAARQVRVWRGGPLNAAGASRNLFLLHGGFGDARWHWHTVWETLAESYTIAAPDLPGFGSTVELPHASFAELIEWIARVQELVGMSQAAFVGNSFGAGLARLYASAHPERVTHLLLVDGGQIPRLPKFARTLMGASFLTPLFELLRRQGFSEKSVQSAFGNPAAVTPEILSASQEASHGFVRLMRRVGLSDVPQNQTPRAPTLLVWGERDKLASVSRAQEIAAEIPNAQLAVVKNAGHMPQLEDPMSFVKIVRDFVQQ
jgi:pimeloyl-ACP methyl ester carboxylesterase